MRNKIKVLFLAADPFRTGAPLRLDEEVRAIEHAIRKGTARDTLELVPHLATRTVDLQDALLRHEPQIVHFAGHGKAPGVIYLGDEQGRPHAVGKEALRGLFGILKGSVQVVVLNGCDTLSTVEALSEVVDYTIGMNRPISDESAIVFAQAFYSALAMGRTVLTAFELGVSQLQIEGSAEAGIPMRRIRRGVNLDATLVPVAEAAEEEEGPAAGADVDQDLELDDVEADLANLIADDHHGPGPAEGRVRQKIRAGSVRATELNIVGRRTGPAPRE
jgi:hypothetical protein